MLQFVKQIAGIAVAIAMGTGMAVAMPTNTDFESGSLNPWYQDADFGGPVNWEITTTAIDGTYSAYDEGNKRLRQDFLGISTDDILSITFNLLTDGHAGNAYNFFYSDGTQPQYIFSGTANVIQLVDVTSNLAAGKTLIGFGLYGNSGGSTTFDNFTITTRVPVPAPAALGLLGLGLISIAAMRRRR